MNRKRQNPPNEPPYQTQPYYPNQPAAANRPAPQYPVEQIPPAPMPPRPLPKQRQSMGCCSCLLTGLLTAGLLALVLMAVYFLAPFRTNLLVLGIDRVPDGTALGRSDTIILVSVVPLKPDITMLSIPRDLWVSIPGVGENRINTAHFFAESNQPGSGPEAAALVVQENFAVDVPYTVRVRFDAFLSVVDALGGVTINLPQDMAGLPAGQHHLNGEQALAFVRDRKGTDDFFRMEHTQFLLRAVARQALLPDAWPRLPDVIRAGLASIDTNLPIWQWPRLGLALLRAGENGIDSRTIRREMVTPTITEGGASVLLPNWDLIRPMVQEMFPQRPW